MNRLHQESKATQEKMGMFWHFFGLYVEQTRTIINWGSMIEHYY